MSRLMMMGVGPSGPGETYAFYSQRVFDLFPQLATANSGWATHNAESLSVFGSAVITDTANDSDYIEWTVYVPAGNYKVSALYQSDPAYGRAVLTVDGGATIDTLDFYADPGVKNNLWTSAQFALTEGSHTIRLTKSGKHASATNYYLALQHAQLIKQDAASALTSVASAPHVINVPIVFADSHTNFNTLAMDTAGAFGASLVSSAAQNDAVTFSFWAPKGNFTLALLHRTRTNGGIYTVTVDGNSIGTINGYDISANYNFLNTALTGTFATTGMHTITFTMSTKDASSTNYQGNIQHIQIRMTSITEPLATDLAPEVALFWPVFAEANTNWNGLAVGSTAAYYYYSYSAGSQNDEITLTSNATLRPGTYRLDLLVGTANDRGKIHILVDGADAGNYDSYSAGSVQNVVGTIASIVLAGFSPHTIKLKMSDKNASSSSYAVRFVVARLIRTGA